jgi:hypothetical protein
VRWRLYPAGTISQENELLLDRKKIRKWAKWVALGLAIVFAVSFVFIGVGQGGGGFNLSEIFSGGGCSSEDGDTTEVADTELQQRLDALEADPTDTEVLLWLADYYESLYDASQGSSTESADSAIDYLQKAIEADSSLTEAYVDLADLHIRLGDYTEAARVLNEATAVSPDEPDVYLLLGRAQKAAGRTGEAILAWQKYLELVPSDSRQAGAIRDELEKMMAPSTTTTLGLSTTTTVAPSATTTTE